MSRHLGKWILFYLAGSILTLLSVVVFLPIGILVGLVFTVLAMTLPTLIHGRDQGLDAPTHPHDPRHPRNH